MRARIDLAAGGGFNCPSATVLATGLQVQHNYGTYKQALSHETRSPCPVNEQYPTLRTANRKV